MNVPIDHRPAVLAIFVLTYVGLAVGRIPGLRVNRTAIALMGAIGMMIVSGCTPMELASVVSWPTLLLLFGFFVISAQLRLSGFYDWMAAGISGWAGGPPRFLLLLIAVSAALSSFLNHDVVCYVLTPVVASALLKRGLDPVPFLVALAASSNIGSAATLIGNPQNMMIATVAGLGFARYLAWCFVPVAFGLACTFALTRMGNLNRPAPPRLRDVEPPELPCSLDRYHMTKGLVVLALVIALLFTRIPREITVLVAASIHLLSTKFRSEDLLAVVDWQILVLFSSLFVVGGTFQATGYGEALVQWMQGIGFNPATPLNETLLTTGLSILINNAPAVVLLVKIVPMTHATAAYVLAMANSFAGSAILMASVANIIVVQQARRLGIVVSFWDFTRRGAPIALASLAGLVGWAVLMGA